MSGRPTSPWRNWARNQHCAPARLARPTTEHQAAEVVRHAITDGLRVKGVGAGHSFTAVACTDGVQVDLSGCKRVLAVDRARDQVTVEAGISLAELNVELDRLGLALENMGDIAYQSVAGATATATHGTGIRFGNLSSQLVGLRLVDGRGEVVTCSAGQRRDIWTAARAGVGALGLVTAATIQCVPAFNLHAIEEPVPVDEVLEQLDDLVRDNDHYELFWIPGTRWALTKRNRRTDEPIRPRSRWQEVRNDILIDNLGFGAMLQVGRRRPELIPKLAKRLPSTGRQEYIDQSFRVFASARWVRFLEMEYAIPVEAFPAAFAEVRALVDRLRVPIGFPVECRFVAGDDVPLSTASGRPTAYIAVHVPVGAPHDQYFKGVEAIMDRYDGRPHWGKLHFQTAATLRDRYPRWDEFQEVRATLDPGGVFTNPELDRVLGPIGG